MSDTQTIDTAEHQREAQRVNKTVSLADGLLAIAKLIVGIMTASNALIADGVHSLADLLTDMIILAATHYGRRAPDEDHPYGHGRIETMASLWLGVVLAVVAGAMIWESLQKLLQGHIAQEASIWAIVITLIALAVKEGLYHWTMHIAIRQNSPLLKASAWHSRTDSASSLIVLVGLVGTWFGWTWLDPLAALLVALMIAKISIDTLWPASKELVDTALPAEQMQALAASVTPIPELQGLHDLRARRLGAEISLDVHLQVAPTISVTEAHEIGMAVTQEFRQQLPNLADVTFHIDTENDREEDHQHREHLPLRTDIIHLLNERWGSDPCWKQRTHLAIHYRHNAETGQRHIDIELFCPHDIHSEESHELSIETPTQRLNAAIRDIYWIGTLSVWIAAD
ncbi:Ferrous-iron efflux pump FieF [Halomonadaceae bacterium LMG 33818]|uniref:cation diffusion facilitator family transporter n=1 Tax=Cernens ardua TaxID=3402176 RepID=UPI003EDC2317